MFLVRIRSLRWRKRSKGFRFKKLRNNEKHLDVGVVTMTEILKRLDKKIVIETIALVALWSVIYVGIEIIKVIAR